MTKSGKHCGKRRNVTFRAISSFVTLFSKSCLLQRCQKASIWGKVLNSNQSEVICKLQFYFLYVLVATCSTVISINLKNKTINVWYIMGTLQNSCNCILFQDLGRSCGFHFLALRIVGLVLWLTHGVGINGPVVQVNYLGLLWYNWKCA